MSARFWQAAASAGNVLWDKGFINALDCEQSPILKEYVCISRPLQCMGNWLRQLFWLIFPTSPDRSKRVTNKFLICRPYASETSMSCSTHVESCPCQELNQVPLVLE